MEKFSRFIKLLLLTAALNVTLPLQIFGAPMWLGILCYVAAVAFFVAMMISPKAKTAPSVRLWVMDCGAEQLYMFIMTMAMSLVPAAVAVWGIIAGFLEGASLAAWLIVLVVGEYLLFWSGIIRVYLTSAQLGLKYRVLGILLGMVPIANLVMLGIIYAKVRFECDLAILRYERNEARAGQRVCSTKYPILLVHGVFFRDSKLLNYWGRIPAELERNGAVLYYGNQQSAGSVERSASELAERIRQICEETGCEKLNIIAHSKGGLDSRYAISRCGCAPYVASLTTINTPHRGCVFAEHLLGKASEGFVTKIENAYNAAYCALGDESPDFLAAVKDLTDSACRRFNEETPDAEGVMYQSVGSIARRAQGGRFPLNVSYPIVKKYDGENDGMVALSSMEWGESFTALYPSGERGITHGDVIDLSREDFRGFDIPEFYVGLIAELKNKGL